MHHDVTGGRTHRYEVLNLCVGPTADVDCERAVEFKRASSLTASEATSGNCDKTAFVSEVGRNIAYGWAWQKREGSRIAVGARCVGTNDPARCTSWYDNLNRASGPDGDIRCLKAIEFDVGIILRSTGTQACPRDRDHSSYRCG